MCKATYLMQGFEAAKTLIAPHAVKFRWMSISHYPVYCPGHDPWLRAWPRPIATLVRKWDIDKRHSRSPGDVTGQPGWLEFSSAGQKPFSGAEM